ncbi:uncharacterized protein [Mycetomoellerius zeteki]|uniref:uncharacterized protein n=1 Tax=Mycetomoellerius zeteki TaxID=64791 RepID=UPI00084E726C|nr:PREDICTED: uncharacterized protein LOC108720980 [Trachymyrmex zeteki]
MTRERSKISLVGIGGKAANRTRGSVGFELSPHFQSEFTCTVTAHILINLTSSIPSGQVDQTLWPHLEGLQLADSQFSSPGAIDLVLGADVYGSIIAEGLITESQNSPIAQLTHLEWIISGPTGHQMTFENARNYHMTTGEDLHLILHRFWEIEEVPPSCNHSLTPDEQQCEDHFRNTHSREPCGRYVVKLPFKQPVSKLGNSKGKATHLIHKLSKRFESDPAYAKMYSGFIAEYSELHHMRLVHDSVPEPSHTYYLPHHGVIRETSLTTKLRVVFNGSSKTTSGFSLNDLLHIGPKLQTDLVNVLIWFRQYRYVFSSDIEKMYRQVRIHPDDWKHQRILWKDDANLIKTYELTTVTYGLACAPFLALRTVNQLIHDEGTTFPLAIPILTHGRYVDDLFGGADSIE